MIYTIRLTPLEHKALLGVLVRYARQKDATQEWLSAIDDTTVTLGDLMTLIAQVVPDRETPPPSPAKGEPWPTSG